MNLVEKVKSTTIEIMNAYQPITNSLSTGRTRDVFSLLTIDYQLEPMNYAGNSRLAGQFDIEFLVSPMPGGVKPTSSYDSIIQYFQNNYALAFKNEGINVLNVNYGNSTIITDKTTGSTSIAFTLNIRALERK